MLPRTARRRILSRGATLTEVLITTGIFSLLVLALFAVMKYGVRSWKNIESRNSVQVQLRKVELMLLEDVKRASFDQIRVKSMPSGWTAGDASILTGKTPHGPELWFLSALDAEGKEFLRDADGKPDWQRNILYYCVKPSDAWHQAHYGFLCKPDTAMQDNLYDTWCPHKWLIRKDIATRTLLDNVVIDSYLSRPTGRDLQYMLASNGGEPGVERVQVLADSVLVFRATLKKPEVLLDIKSFRLLEAGDLMHVGESSLDDNVFTVQYDARIVPNN